MSWSFSFMVITFVCDSIEKHIKLFFITKLISDLENFIFAIVYGKNKIYYLIKEPIIYKYNKTSCYYFMIK